MELNVSYTYIVSCLHHTLIVLYSGLFLHVHMFVEVFFLCFDIMLKIILQCTIEIYVYQFHNKIMNEIERFRIFQNYAFLQYLLLYNTVVLFVKTLYIDKRNRHLGFILYISTTFQRV